MLDAIARALDCGKDEFKVEHEIELSKSVSRALLLARRAADDAAAAKQKVTKANRAVVLALRKSGVTAADAGEILGLTRSRVYQMLIE